MEHKRWQKIVPPGDTYHISRNLMNRKDPIPLHDHDFAEMLWIVQGSGVHRVNGHVEKLLAGNLVMILPTDAHALEPLSGATLNVINVVIPASLVPQLRRYCLDEDTRWFRRRGAVPETVQLDIDELAALSREFDWLTHAPRNRQSIVTFCLNVVRIIGIWPTMATGKRLPLWLAEAMRTFVPSTAVAGPPTLRRFFQKAGRSPEHIARVMRQRLNTTPTAWVNQQRIQYAARLLEVSDQSVLEVALNSGFENAGYFHAMFMKTFGTTPKQYRDRHRRAV